MKSHPGWFSPTSLVKGRLRTAVLVAVTALVVSLVGFLRMPPSARGVVWAEDGGIFLRDAIERNGLLDIFAPYDGYLHVLPRVAAKSVVRLFAVDDYGLAMNFLSCVVTAFVCLGVFHFSKELTSNIHVRLAWASITVLVAPAPLETLGNFANVHSYLLWLAPWMLLSRSTSRASASLLFLAGLLVSLTEIASVLFVPLLALRFRDRGLWPGRIGLLAGLSCQAIATMSYPRAHPEPFPLDLGSVALGWFLNGPVSLIYGNAATIVANVQNYGAWAIVLATIPFLLAALFIFCKGSTEHKIMAIIFLYASITVWVLTQAVNFQEYFDYANFDENRWTLFFLSRYSTVPSMFLLATLPLAALCDRSRFRRLAAAVLGGFLVLQVLYFFPQNTARNGGPDWREGVQVARAACDQDPYRQSSTVNIAPAGWLKEGVTIDCALLRSRP